MIPGGPSAIRNTTSTGRRADIALDAHHAKNAERLKRAHILHDVRSRS